jgi:2'-5' RNA ligase
VSETGNKPGNQEDGGEPRAEAKPEAKAEAKTDNKTERGTDTGRKRCFLAVNLSLAVTRKIAETTELLRRSAKEAGVPVTWVPPANLHVTLKFLGSVREDSIEAVRGVARDTAAAQPVFEVRAQGAGAFPSQAKARVVWIGVRGADPLVRMAGHLDDKLGQMGFEKEARAFHPHVTVGRVKEGASSNLEKLLAPLDGKDFGTSMVSELVLYESRLHRTGSEYVALARLPLGSK